MDCLEAREIVSEAFDRGVAATPRAAEAREHCRACDDCRAFVEGLGTLDAVPAPQASEKLVESIIWRGRKMADAGVPRSAPRVPTPVDGSAEAQEAAAWVPPQPPPRREEPRDALWWVPRIAIGLAAAATVVFAVGLSLQGFRALRTPAESAPTAATMDQRSIGGSPSYGAAGAPAAAPATSADEAKAASATASVDGTGRYVSFGDQAYLLLGERQPDSSSLNGIGSLTSSLDTTSEPKQYRVWQSTADADVVFVQAETAAPGTYLAFRRVERSFGGKPFVLYASPDVTSFGMWPSLPSTFATPTAGDGSPTFVAAGKDDTGLTVYAQPGASAAGGFAVAPGTSSGDPAGGDPNWTWWLPKR